MDLAMRIGISISADSVRAVALARDRVVWTSHSVRDAQQPIEESIRKVLESAPVSRWRHPTLRVALGPSLVRVKRLTGVPQARDTRTIARLVQVNANRFFLQSESQRLVTAVCIAKDGTVLGAAADGVICDQVSRACGALRVRFGGTTPSVVALAALLGNGSTLWVDGATVTRIDAKDSQLVAIQHLTPNDVSTRDCPEAAQRALGETAAFYGDAYAAALLTKPGPMQLGNHLSSEHSKRIPKLRTAAAVAACVLGILGPLTAPLIGARIELARGKHELAFLAPRQREALRRYNDIQYFTRGLDEVAAFGMRGISATALLGDLTRGLPAGIAIVTLRIDSTGGNLTVLGKNAASAVRTLETLPRIVNPHVTGAVTREIVDAVERERVSLQFHVAGSRPNRDTSTPPPNRGRS